MCILSDFLVFDIYNIFIILKCVFSRDEPIGSPYRYDQVIYANFDFSKDVM